MHQHIQALCCLSKDPFQQILCRGVLHERASLGCFPERHAQTHGHVKDSSFVEGGFNLWWSLLPFGDTISTKFELIFNLPRSKLWHSTKRNWKLWKLFITPQAERVHCSSCIYEVEETFAMEEQLASCSSSGACNDTVCASVCWFSLPHVVEGGYVMDSQWPICASRATLGVSTSLNSKSLIEAKFKG